MKPEIENRLAALSMIAAVSEARTAVGLGTTGRGAPWRRPSAPSWSGTLRCTQRTPRWISRRNWYCYAIPGTALPGRRH